MYISFDDHWFAKQCITYELKLSWQSYFRISGTGVANQSESKSHISYCVTAKSHTIHVSTHEHHPSLSHSHTYLYSARCIVNIAHQHDSDRTLQAIYY